MAPTINKTYTEAGAQITRDDDKWGSSTLGTAASITYGYRPLDQFLAPSYVATAFEHDLDGRQVFTDPQKAQAVIAVSLWSDIANITFTFAEPGSGPIPDNPDIYMSTYIDPTDGADGFAFLPSSVVGGDVWIDVSLEGSNPPVMRTDAGFQIGTYLFETLMHEIGHAIGLQHPGDYNASAGTTITYEANAQYIQDSRQFSIMSYFGEDNTGANFGERGAATPLLHDIAAVQRLYGANMSTRTTSDTYGFGSALGPIYTLANAEQKIWAIWDAGGTDTFNFSGYNVTQTIFLEAAIANQPSADVKFSSVGGLTKNVVIAPGVTIENAIGGSAADAITGNAVDNALEGRNGDDVLAGLDGNDTLTGGVGADQINGGAGYDIAAYTSAAGETVTLTPTGAAELGTWTVTGPAESTGDALSGIEGFRFGAGHDIVTLNGPTGPTRTITLDGNDGNDTLTGNADSEILIGGLGTDTLKPRGGVFAAYGGARTSDPNVWNESFAQGDYLIMDRTTFGANYNFFVFGPTWTGTDGSTARGIARMNYAGSAFNDWVHGAAGSDVLRGNAGTDTLEGRDGNDLIEGGDAFDVLYGDEGNDTLRGGLGDDFMRGGNGNDRLETGGGGGTSFGDAGDDTLIGSVDGERLAGGAGNDRIEAFGGNDSLEGDDGDDTLLGGDGDDSFHPGWGFGVETMDGGAGADTVFLDRRSLTGNISFFLNGPAGSDGTSAINMERLSYDGSAGQDVVRGDTGADTIFGNDGDDILEGGGGLDSLWGYEGNDTLRGGLGDDIMRGGNGNDRLETGGGGGNAFGEVGNDTLIGSADGETMDGGADNDRIEAFGGNDQLNGGDGNDTLLGGDGDDNFFPGLGVETMDGGAGFDSVYLDRRTLTGNISIFLNGPAGSDGTTAINMERLTYDGSAGQDVVRGDTGADTIFGNDGDDTLEGGGGLDSLYGYEGNDTLRGGLGDDIMRGGNGNDRLETGGGGNTFGEAGDDTLIGSIDGEGLAGNSGNDRIEAFGGNDELYGDDGNDTLLGGGGADRLFGGADIDTASYLGAAARVKAALDGSFASEGEALGDTFVFIERLIGTIFGDVLRGDAGDNRISGYDGADTLQGMAGNDILHGGAGGDALTGGLGNDGFEYTALAQGGDTLKDFHNLAGDNDSLRFSGAVFGGLPAGALAATRFRANTTGLAGDGDDRFIYETDTGILRFDGNGNVAGGVAVIATLTGLPSITAADFVIN